MKKFSSNKALLFSLITAFVLLQWSAMHIHLEGEHKHGGSEHQHSLTAHQHQSVSHHADAIDSAADSFSHSDGSKVVEVENVCTQFNGKLSEQYAVVNPSGFSLLEQLVAYQDKFQVYEQGSFLPYHQYTPVFLRAPPTLS